MHFDCHATYQLNQLYGFWAVRSVGPRGRDGEWGVGGGGAGATWDVMRLISDVARDQELRFVDSSSLCV